MGGLIPIGDASRRPAQLPVATLVRSVIVEGPGAD